MNHPAVGVPPWPPKWIIYTSGKSRDTSSSRNLAVAVMSGDQRKTGCRLKTGYLKLAQTLMMIACSTFSNSFQIYSRWNDSKRLSVGPHPAFPGKASLQKWRHIFFLLVKVGSVLQHGFLHCDSSLCVSSTLVIPRVFPVPIYVLFHSVSLSINSPFRMPQHAANLRNRREGDTTDTTVQKMPTIHNYPLVNIQKAIENCHRNSGFTH